MIRLYDWECPRGHKQEATIVYPQGTTPPRTQTLACRYCQGRKVPHTRLIPLTAKYLADRPFSPRVAGGSFDTIGKRQMPMMPEIPDSASDSDVIDIYNSPAWKAAKAERKAIRKENDAKKKRAAAGVSFRHHRLPGDPKMVS